MSRDEVTVKVPASALQALGKWVLLAIGAAASSGTGLLVVQRASPVASPSASDGERRELAASVDSLAQVVHGVKSAVDSARTEARFARIASDSSAARLARAEKLLVALASDRSAIASPSRQPRPSTQVPAGARLEDALYTSAIGADQ